MSEIKILHWSNYAPRRSGLYEAVREFIKYERHVGIDAQMAILEEENPPDDWEDGGIKPVSWDWAEQADMYVVHRGLPQKVVEKVTKPFISIIHGTADHLVQNDIMTNADMASFNTHINFMNNGSYAIAVNDHDYEIYKNYINKPERLKLIWDGVDIKHFTISGYRHPYRYHPQIIFADSIRNNKNPSFAMWAMPEVKKEIPTARFSVYSLQLLSIVMWRNILLRAISGLHSCMEDIQMQSSELRPYYRGADILINGNITGIPSRVELEAMSCGCQVISLGNGSWTKYHMKSMDVKDVSRAIIDCWNDIKDRRMEARREARENVENNFNIEMKIKAEYIPLYKKVLEGK